MRRFVEIPKGVTLNLEVNSKITVKGKLGTLERSFPYISTRLELVTTNDEGRTGNFLAIFDYYPKRRQKSLIGTIEGLVKNMITGVQFGYLYKMKIVYTHFPITLTPAKDGVVLAGHYGEKGKSFVPILPGVKVTIKGDDVLLEGIDIEAVSQSAARIQDRTKLKGKHARDPRVFMDGIYVYESGIKR